jgi:cytochrome c-type biogenesis protein CcmH/NrfG
MVAIIAILLVLGTVAYIGYPILRRDQSFAPDPFDVPSVIRELRTEKDTLLRVLKDLEFDLASGKLSAADYDALRSRYETRAMTVLQELDTLESTLGRRPSEIPTPQDALVNPSTPSRPIWSRPVFAASVVGCLVLIIGVGGFLLGRVTRNGPEELVARNPDQGGESTLTTALEGRLSQNPRDLEALVGLGRIYLQSGQLPKAIEFYKRALEVDGNNVSALSGLAMILAQAGHSDQALGLFDRVLAINPQVPMALLFRGRLLYEDKKDFSGAIANWEEFLRIMPQGGPAEVVRGWIEEARREARKVEEGVPSTRTP